MRVLLLHPQVFSPGFIFTKSDPRRMSLGLLYIASVLEIAGHEVCVGFATKGNIHNLLKKFKPQLIGFSVITADYLYTKDLVKSTKKENPEIKIVLGGYHPTFLPDEVLKETEADFVIRGEGENAMSQLVTALEGDNDLSEVNGLSYKRQNMIVHNDPGPMVDVDTLPFPAREKIEISIQGLSEDLTHYYQEAEAVIGAGIFASNQICIKPLELAYGISELDIGITSTTLENKRPIINPFLMNWILNEFCEVKNKKIKWITQDIELSKPNKTIPEVPIKTLNIKCYIPSKELIRAGATEKGLRKRLKSALISTKPFLMKSDIIMPLTLPSIVVGVEHPEKKAIAQVPYMTYYGTIPLEKEVLYKISPLTDLKIKFFEFPLFNKKIPVILDTSAIDVSRFPLSPFGSFFEAYLQDKVLIIPSAALHEVKTRLRGGDRTKVQKALVRLNKLVSWGALEAVKVDGELPELSTAKKEDIEDLRDCMILEVTRKNGGILFSNDINLLKLATLTGVYTISFSGLEEDVLRIIKNNNLKMTKEMAVEKIREYGSEERLEVYKTEDIEWMIDHLCGSGLICVQRLDKKDVLEYLRKGRKNSAK